MEYVIVGAGSLGQSFAGLLARDGQRVTLLATPRGEQRLRANGAIRLRGAVEADVALGADGLSVTSEPANVPQGAVVVFTPKGHDLPAAVEAVRVAAGDRVGWACGVQNGLVKDDILIAAFGPERVVGGVTIFGAQRQLDDSVQVASPGATYLGEFDSSLSERVSQAAQAFEAAGIPTHATPHIASVLWSKACNATGVFGVTGLARASNQQLFASPDLMRAYLALVRETAAVAAAYDVEVGDFPSFPPIRTFVERDDQATLDRLTPASSDSPPSYASMTSDLLAGRALEVDAVFGDIVDRAERRGVPVPCLRLTRDLLRGLNAGPRSPVR